MARDCNRYTCERCRGTFVTDWTVAEADAEAETRYGVQNASAKLGPADGDMAMVCEDCFKLIMAGQPS
jgi:hypothetical protein